MRSDYHILRKSPHLTLYCLDPPLLRMVTVLKLWEFNSCTCEQRRRCDGRAGAVKNWGEWNLIKNKNIITNMLAFFSRTMLTSKIITENTENHYEFSGCSIICNKCFNSILIKLEITLGTVIIKVTSAPFWKGREAMPCSRVYLHVQDYNAAIVWFVQKCNWFCCNVGCHVLRNRQRKI